MTNEEDVHKIMACTLLDDNAEKAEALFVKGLAVVREALRADRVVLGRDGEPQHLGPDYTLRISGFKLLVRLCLGNRKLSSKAAPVREEAVYAVEAQAAYNLELELDSLPESEKPWNLRAGYEMFTFKGHPNMWVKKRPEHMWPYPYNLYDTRTDDARETEKKSQRKEKSNGKRKANCSQPAERA